MMTGPKPSEILDEFFRLVLGEPAELAQDPAGRRVAELCHQRVVLQHLARDVERHVLRIDDAADVAQIGGPKIGLVGDMDAPYCVFLGRIAALLDASKESRIGVDGKPKTDAEIARFLAPKWHFLAKQITCERPQSSTGSKAWPFFTGDDPSQRS